MKYSIPHYDVIIIGAGSIGTPAAFSMAQSGLRTLVVDSAPSVGQGSNKSAIGGIRATHSDPAKIRLCQRSLQIFSSWKETYGDDIEWFQGGYCFVAYRDQEKRTLQELLVTQKSMGLDIQWLSTKDLLDIVPDLNPINLLGGTYSPEDGSASPLLAVHAFYSHAKAAGAEFHFNETVIKIITRNSRIIGVETNISHYGTDVILNAAGAQAMQIGHMVNIDLSVRPDCHEAAVTEPVARFLKPLIVDIRPSAGSSNCYFYQHSTGQLLFCLTPNPSIWGYDTRETSQFLPMVSKRMLDVMPRLANIRIRRTWRGLYPMTPDGFPIIGWAESVEGFLLAVGMCGQGFMLGPGVAELLTRLVLNKTTVEDRKVLQYLTPNRKFTFQEALK